MQTVQYKNLKFQVWDLGGQNSIRQILSQTNLGTVVIFSQVLVMKFDRRQYWEMYYPSTNAILYVVDSKDKQRFAKAAEELSKVLNVFLLIIKRNKFFKVYLCLCWQINRIYPMLPRKKKSVSFQDSPKSKIEIGRFTSVVLSLGRVSMKAWTGSYRNLQITLERYLLKNVVFIVFCILSLFIHLGLLPNLIQH